MDDLEPSSPKGIDFSSYIPVELCYYLVSHLSPKDLIDLSYCSQRMHFFATSNLVWAPLCKWRWKGKQGLQESIAARHDNWWKVEGSWKRAYAIVEIESRRTHPDLLDMAESKWLFRRRLSRLDTQFNDPQAPFAGNPVFHSNFKYTHTGLLQGAFDVSWRITKDGRVQVAQYPYLIPTRVDSNWSWCFENMYVHFNSVDNAGFRRALTTLDCALAIKMCDAPRPLDEEAAIPLVFEGDASSSSSQRNALVERGTSWED
ncbi:hypothetical protein BC937DRAFT_90056 [Endogone sp. FLAS-F59071]|nr:hypothetical protein BC937DRAFT_90056 [Endogone sp. FLAS-F59071]|eukprot:RUS17381.1 hypothetical protein BC937DRAFT_90056 [Endogone sp. FLAS-F59071]